jgi:hypothetical protein
MLQQLTNTETVPLAVVVVMQLPLKSVLSEWGMQTVSIIRYMPWLRDIKKLRGMK